MSTMNEDEQIVTTRKLLKAYQEAAKAEQKASVDFALAGAMLDAARDRYEKALRLRTSAQDRADLAMLDIYQAHDAFKEDKCK